MFSCDHVHAVHDRFVRVWTGSGGHSGGLLACLGNLGTVLEASLERLGGVLEGVER